MWIGACCCGRWRKIGSGKVEREDTMGFAMGIIRSWDQLSFEADRFSSSLVVGLILTRGVRGSRLLVVLRPAHITILRLPFLDQVEDLPETFSTSRRTEISRRLRRRRRRGWHITNFDTQDHPIFTTTTTLGSRVTGNITMDGIKNRKTIFLGFFILS